MKKTLKTGKVVTFRYDSVCKDWRCTTDFKFLKDVEQDEVLELEQDSPNWPKGH